VQEDISWHIQSGGTDQQTSRNELWAATSNHEEKGKALKKKK
jgi:hypothetical protein